MNCPNCGSIKTKTENVTEWFPYGQTEQAFEATFPVHTCTECTFSWRDHASELPIDTARAEYEAQLAAAPTKGIEDLKEEVHNFLDEYMRPGEEEDYRQALLLLAAEI